MAKRKQVTMLVTVSGPNGMSAAQARANVRQLIKGQNFCGTWVVLKLASGHLAFSKAEEIDEYNFHVRSVRPVRAR